MYTAEPNEYLKDSDSERKMASFSYSLGCLIGEKTGLLEEVRWGSPAFKASLTEGMTVVAVNREAYSAEALGRAITRAAKDRQPLELIVRSDDHFDVVLMPYYEGLRYPHLKRVESVPARLDDILMALP